MFIVCRIFVSLILCITSSCLTRSVHPISILPQYHTSKLPRYLCLVYEVSEFLDVQLTLKYICWVKYVLECLSYGSRLHVFVSIVILYMFKCTHTSVWKISISRIRFVPVSTCGWKCFHCSVSCSLAWQCWRGIFAYKTFSHVFFMTHTLQKCCMLNLCVQMNTLHRSQGAETIGDSCLVRGVKEVTVLAAQKRRKGSQCRQTSPHMPSSHFSALSTVDLHLSFLCVSGR
jgi:hypothetical protein